MRGHDLVNAGHLPHVARHAASVHVTPQPSKKKHSKDAAASAVTSLESPEACTTVQAEEA